MNKAMKRGWEWEVCRLACENMGKQFMSLDVSDVTVSDGLKRRVEGLLTEAREAAARRKALRRRVTVILVAAVLLLLTACASIPAVREKLYDIVFSEHDKYYRFQTKPKETEENTAETAPLPPFENKKPTYIPEGFELTESDVGLQETFYMYLNSNNSNDYFVFGQDYVSASKHNISSEGIQMRDIKVSGIDGILITWEGDTACMILWNDGIYDYYVLSIRPYEEAIKIAESVR